MFVRVNNNNFYINPKNKTVSEIYYEIFARMNKTKITPPEKRKIISEIKKQLHEKI
jgi:hypothetical protein